MLGGIINLGEQAASVHDCAGSGQSLFLYFNRTDQDTQTTFDLFARGTRLVYAMLQAADWTKLKGFDLSASHEHFYTLEAHHYNPGGSGLIGLFAVDQTTGDVWYSVTCQRLTSRALVKAQESLRKLIGMSDTDYRTLRKPGPSCEPNEVPQIWEMGRPRPDALPHPDR